MAYTWKDFNIVDAEAGALIGLGGSTDPADISKVAGRLQKTNVYTGMKVTIDGVSAYIDVEGKVKACVPSGAIAIDTPLKIATTQIREVVGNVYTRSEAVEGYTNVVPLSTMEARDHFAVQVLNSMLVHAEHPEAFDDANIMLYCRSAYRWANAMMVAAANTRTGTKESEGGDAATEEVDVSGGSVSEKLLNNIVVSLNNINARLGGTLKVDNPADDTFDIEGGGGGGLDYDKLNDIGSDTTSIVGFNAKAPGRVEIGTLYDVLKVLMDADFDAKGAAAQALAEAKDYTDSKIGT